MVVDQSSSSPKFFLFPTLRAMTSYSPLQSSSITRSVRNTANCDLHSQACRRCAPLRAIQRYSHRGDVSKVTDKREVYENHIHQIAFATRRGPELLRRRGARRPWIPNVISNRTWPFNVGLLHNNPTAKQTLSAPAEPLDARI